LYPTLLEEPSYTSYGKTSVESSLKFEDTIETTASDQVLNSRSLNILEHSPDDEVEGEIVYLQARLLENAAVLNHRYGKSISFVYLFCTFCTKEGMETLLTSVFPMFITMLLFSSIPCLKLPRLLLLFPQFSIFLQYYAWNCPMNEVAVSLVS
jgi:hypothetical protein